MIQSSSCPQWQPDRPGPAGDHDGLAVVTPLTGTRSIRDTFDDDLIIVTPKLSTRSQELLNTMASRIFGCGGFVWAQNEARTPCYHFATQLGSTGRYGSEQGKAFERNPADNSVLTGTEQNTK
jgi:hypothetical protein